MQITAIGNVEPLSTVQVVSQVTGLVTGVEFKEGDFVKEGQLLFTIDTRPYSATLASAHAQLAKDEALAAQARDDAERASKLAEAGLATTQDLARARANQAALEAALAADKAQIRGASLNVQFAQIRSPIEGRTGSLLIHAGNVVRAADARPLVVIRTMRPVYVRFAVPEVYLQRIRTRMQEGPLSVQATPRGNHATPADGTLTFLENAVDPATGTITLKAEFKNENYELWPGAFVDVALRLSVDKGAIVAPEAAVQTGQEGAYAYVVGAGNKAELRKLTVLREVGQKVVIGSGLVPSERVVTDGLVRLREGSAVTIRPSAPSAEPKASAAIESPSSRAEPPAAPTEAAR